MSDYRVTTCTTEGCDTPLAGEVGVYYCDRCVAEQMREYVGEVEAFDAFHAYADRVARGQD